jgi:hypothetical protein
MMKKLLVLALVLSVVGLANASLSLSADLVSKTISVEGLFDQDAYLLLTSDGGVTEAMMGIAAGAASADTGMSATDFAGAVGLNIEGTGVAFVFATFPGEAYKDGQYLKGTYGQGATFANLYFFSEVTGESGLLESIAIPEPMTMVLLGLGGLFLRRK